MRTHTKFSKYLLVGLALLLILSGCSQLTQQAEPTEAPQIVEDVPPVVSATGKVVPTRWSTLSVSVPGVVEEIAVAEGDLIQEGDMLLRLRGKEDLEAALAAAQAELVSAQQAYDQLNEQAEQARTQALARIMQANQDVRDAKYLLDNYTVPNYMEDMDPFEAVRTYREQLDQARDAFDAVRYLSKSNDRREQALDEMDSAQSDYNSAVRWLTLELQLQEADERLQRAIADYEEVKDGPKAEDVAAAEARIDSAQAALAAAQASRNDLELQAPFAGQVTTLDARQGEWVSPGVPLVTLADLDHLRVETTDLNEIDVARVQAGDPATITFDALPSVQVQGTVSQIALRASQGSGVNYSVLIELDQVPDALRWDMTAFVDVEVQE